VLGVVLVMDFINGHIEALRIAGGCFLIYLGIRMMLAETSQPVVEGLGARTRQVGKIFVSSFFLTITNPMTIFAFIAIFAGLGLSGLHGFSYTLFVIAGIFVGSLLWWLILSSMVYKLKVKISPENLHRINVVAGSLIVGFGVFALLTVFKPFII
jgi:threonine/homoserine/homoserine lactone efflux protein